MFVVGEVLLYDANGNILALTEAGEARVEAIQKAGAQFQNVIADPLVPARQAEVNALRRLMVEAYPPNGQTGNNVVITDPLNVNNQAAVDSSGRLTVIVASATTPPGKTPWEEFSVETTEKSGGTDVWNQVIPAGETLTLQSFEAGAFVTFGDNMLRWKCDLFWQPLGNATDEEQIDTIYLQGQSTHITPFDRDFIGDGTARFHVEILNESAGASEARLTLRGYY